MRVCFLTLGTRGDVQPYLALAKYLISKGHSAVLCTSESFRDFILSEGVEFHRATLDLMELAESEIGKKVLEHPLKNLKLGLQLANEIMSPGYRQTFDDFYAAAQGADVIIYHPKALVAVDIAEKLNIACVSMPPVPMIAPISEFPNLAISGTKNFGGFLNKLSYSVNKKADSKYMKEINSFREETLSLKKRKAGEFSLTRNGAKIPIVYPISKYLFEDVKSWENDVFISGFYFLDTVETLSEELETFIESGTKPITVSFSSMPLSKPSAFIEKLEFGLEETNNRAVLIVGNSGMDIKSSDRIFVVKSAAHGLLFPKSKAVIHHGGAGTSAAALVSAVPQLVMPFSVDQPFWAKRMFDKGVSVEPIKEVDLTKEILCKKLKQFDDENLQKNAKILADKIKSENASEDTMEYLLKL